MLGICLSIRVLCRFCQHKSPCSTLLNFKRFAVVWKSVPVELIVVGEMILAPGPGQGLKKRCGSRRTGSHGVVSESTVLAGWHQRFFQSELGGKHAFRFSFTYELTMDKRF